MPSVQSGTVNKEKKRKNGFQLLCFLCALVACELFRQRERKTTKFNRKIITGIIIIIASVVYSIPLFLQSPNTFSSFDPIWKRPTPRDSFNLLSLSSNLGFGDGHGLLLTFLWIERLVQFLIPTLSDQVTHNFLFSIFSPACLVTEKMPQRERNLGKSSNAQFNSIPLFSFSLLTSRTKWLFSFLLLFLLVLSIKVY